jgi:hypothetical protein
MFGQIKLTPTTLSQFRVTAFCAKRDWCNPNMQQSPKKALEWSFWVDVILDTLSS